MFSSLSTAAKPTAAPANLPSPSSPLDEDEEDNSQADIYNNAFR